MSSVEAKFTTVALVELEVCGSKLENTVRG